MRNILILSAVAAAALAGTAHSATISIGTSINGGAIKTQSSGAAPGPVTFSGAVGSYDLDTVSAVDLTAASLDSNSINATTLGTKDTLNVFVASRVPVPKTVFELSSKVLSVTVQPGVKKFTVRPLRACTRPLTVVMSETETNMLSVSFVPVAVALMESLSSDVAVGSMPLTVSRL